MSEEKKVIETLKKGYGLTIAETEILSNLIEKQQKEIETWKETENDYEHELARKDEKIKEQQKEIEELEHDRKLLIQGHKMAKYNVLVIEGREYISKDKIREKIKELEQIKNTALTERTVEMMEDKINILNLVLKENNNDRY